jgi:hypothetical protein
MLVTDPSEIPDERFHTVDISTIETGEHSIVAQNDETYVTIIVDSVGIGGESAGFQQGDMRLDAGDSWIHLSYEDFRDEHGYEEIQITFEER